MGPNRVKIGILLFIVAVAVFLALSSCQPGFFQNAVPIF
jgi:hypothetical protein